MGLKNQLGGGGGVLSKNNAKIGGLKFKLLLLQGGPNFHFMSCAFALNWKNNSTCTVKLLFSQAASFHFSPFLFCPFLFLASDVVDLVPI